jgi:hypothetical protein
MWSGLMGKCAMARRETVALQPGRVMILCQPGVIRVCQGTIWLTATPAKTDVILRLGERFDLAGNCPYVLEALTDAKIAVSDEV